MYQKCHDEDCSQFVSKAKPLPLDVTFQFEDEADSLLMSVDFKDCSQFVSKAKSLPIDVAFQFEDETDSLLMSVDLD